ncbi:hypothetical protein QQZ08_010650 [Neonectria magnoliae]|uniref:Uncharacterized protein n=1 Tax=Neonectria magnoliae TaxID=2732573 RepID=A0ABR1HG73_9HYPO
MASAYPELGTFVRNLTTSSSVPSIRFQNDIWIYVITLIVLSSSVTILLPLAQREVKVPIPLAANVANKKSRKEAYCFDSRATLKQGYDQFKDKPFGVDSMEGVKLIVPMSFLDKLRSHPSLSFQKSIDNDLMRAYTGIGGIDTFGVNVITKNFNPTIPSAFVMHDEEASNNSDWLKIIEDYVIQAAGYAQALKTWPPFLRPFVCRFLPHRREMSRQWSSARAIVKATLDAKRSGAKSISNPPTILDHLTSGPNEERIRDLDAQLQQQLLLAVASIHTTSSSVLHCLYDLAARPEYVSELRQEAKEVLEACGGVFTKEGLGRLEKLDSFMKESQRLCSPDLTTFQRMAVKPLTLPDGTYVPAKTKLEIATSAINIDGTYFENPETFDGLRFYRRRQNGESNLIYTSVGRTNLGWGVGRHACPGRFLADVEIKIIIAELLLRYDIKNPEGQGRYKNFEFEAIVFPDPEAKIMLKAIE